MKRKQIRRTKKLLSAAEILSDNPRGDCSPDEFIENMEKHRIKPDQVYKYMARINHVWDGYYWYENIPAWLKKVNHNF